MLNYIKVRKCAQRVNKSFSAAVNVLHITTSAHFVEDLVSSLKESVFSKANVGRRLGQAFLRNCLAVWIMLQVEIQFTGKAIWGE